MINISRNRAMWVHRMGWESDTLGRVKRIWNTWDIRVFMLTSLLIQISLTFLAPFGKRCSSGLFSFCIWLMYLSADAVALFTIGLISSSQGKSPQSTELNAFWAPFLLLHLGGPDTITALALEDNELWLRHALQFATQVLVTVYVFAQSLRKKNHLWLPTVLMFVDGSIKYIERTCALYYASSDTFRDSLAKESETRDYHAKFSNRNRSIMDGEEVLHWYGVGSVRMVSYAYKCYYKFKDLLVDSFVSKNRKDESRAFFLQIPKSEALKLIEMELNIIYDVFYTKVFLVQKKRAYARMVCFISVMASVLLFTLKYKNNYDKIDVGITLTLLGGAVGLDICAALQFLFSDWCTIINSASKGRMLRRWWLHNRDSSHGRWSRTISQYNLLERCKDVPTYFKYIFIHRLKHVLIGWLYVHNEPISPELMEFITEELYKKANLATDADITKEICSDRGNLAHQDEYFLISGSLNRWTVDTDYDESVLIWHLDTDICYWLGKFEMDNHSIYQDASTNDVEACYRQHSKQLSDYMLYVLLRQKTMVSSVSGLSDIRFKDTVTEARKWVSWGLEQHMGSVSRGEVVFPGQHPMDEYCMRLLANIPEEKPLQLNGKISKSVVFDACHLAKHLQMFEEKQWEITSKVWVELLCYAAVRSSARSHVAQLNTGGELITIVWLFMAHLGLGERFQLHPDSRLTRRKDKFRRIRLFDLS